MTQLELVRSHERMDIKRCPTKWYWKWRKGLIPKAKNFGPLELGTWAHYAFEHWYGMGYKRNGQLADHFNHAVEEAVRQAIEAGAPEFVLDKAEELAALGEAMMVAYQRFYGADEDIYVLAVEIPLEFSIPDRSGNIIALHRLKPDLVYRDRDRGVWLLENKTAAQIRTEHLVIDDQARPYGVMAESALRKMGVLKKADEFKGIMYNFVRKALPDEREMNEKGLYLNKDGTVSKRQPTPLFLRHPVKLTRPAKKRALERIQDEVIEITTLTKIIRDRNDRKVFDFHRLGKTPHSSCAKTCQFFTMCVADEQGTDIHEMERSMFDRRDPYDYEDTTDIPVGFELG